MTARATLLVAGLAVAALSGCKETVIDAPPPARLGAADVPPTVTVPQVTRTDHFAESARRIRTHPALGPHTPAEIKRRAAELVEPIQLAVPPKRVVAIEVAEENKVVVPEVRTQVASLVPVPVSQPAPAAVRVSTAGADKAAAGARLTTTPVATKDGSERATPRNVVIPMVVSSADGRWRAESGEGPGKGGARNGHCRAEALEQLRQHSPAGYRIYERIADKRMFTTWILCDDRQRGLTTAVHEAVHMLTEQLDAFPLIDGGQIKRIAALERFMKPGRIAGQFPASDDFVRTYLLPGGASSADDFTYLIDEFNSYVHDLNAAIDTRAMAPKNSRLGHRDGMSAMMSFLMAYVALAEKEDPRTWAGLHRPNVKHLVTTLWSEAERTMEKACKVPRYAVDDRAFLEHICTPANGRALGHMLGRSPRCPRACLGDATG